MAQKSLRHQCVQSTGEIVNSKWDKRFLELAEHVAQWSKDPSTKVGCVIANTMKQVVSVGYNGFPRGVEDTPERLNDRETKYRLVVHSEPNAIANANSSVRGCTAYTWPFGPCVECMKVLATNGITRVVHPALSDELRERWGDSLQHAADLAKEVGIQLVEL